MMIYCKQEYNLHFRLTLAIYFYYNTNTGETTWSLPVHRYVGHVAPSTLSTALPTTQRALKKELDIEPRTVDAGLKPMSMVGGILNKKDSRSGKHDFIIIILLLMK